ncbi:LOW QUALITY PROTEIN: proton-coupled zinc antiporter SLC30A2-like [Macrobrachium nipponense]|uniref:LOW QUALITY PROTEIN: proton-coupled zinc antiporter SLC30A2-like n=1 Tax=Macrobrachium nipponense TaxID=159736 RepID=UPI0030C8BCE4
MAEGKKLKSKRKSASSYGTLPDLQTPVDVDDEKSLLGYSSSARTDEFSESEKSGNGYQSGGNRSYTSFTSHTSQTSYTASQYASKRSSMWSGKSSTTGKYELWMPRSRTDSCGSTGSGSSDELFSRSSSSSKSTHCHDIITETPGDRQAMFKLTMASVLSLVFMALEYVGGYYSSSLAVLSDAGHLLSDFCGFLVSLVALSLMRRPPSKAMSFGYYRAEVLGSVASVLIVWVVTGLLVGAAVQRLMNPDYTLNADIMLAMASVGIGINIVIAAILHGCGCTGFYHGVHKSTGKNINVKAALIHIIADTLQTVAVLIAALVVKFKPELKIADPILTFVFALIVIVTTLPILRDLAHILMEGTPRNVDYLALLNDLEGLPGVRAVHNLHIWSLTLDKNALSAHLVVDQSFESDTVLEEAQKLIRKEYHVCKSTIQVERYLKEMDTCTKCQPIQ